MSSSQTKGPWNNLPPALFRLTTEPRWKGVFLGKISYLGITKHDFSLEHPLTVSYPVLCSRVLLGPAGQVGEEH